MRVKITLVEVALVAEAEKALLEETQQVTLTQAMVVLEDQQVYKALTAVATGVAVATPSGNVITSSLGTETVTGSSTHTLTGIGLTSQIGDEDAQGVRQSGWNRGANADTTCSSFSFDSTRLLRLCHPCGFCKWNAFRVFSFASL